MAKKILVAPVGAKTVVPRVTGRLLVKIDAKAEVGGVLKGLKGVVLERLRVAVIEEESAGELRQRAAVKGSPFILVEEERRLRKLVVERPFVDGRAATWGIQAVNVGKSAYTGKGVKMAVLDTGFDFTHKDFEGRTIHRKSFVGRQAIDKDGHGTHCAGIAGGNRAIAMVGAEGTRGKAASPKDEKVKVKGKAGFRYGVAPGARLYIGKILDDAGEGSDGSALEGIEWALEKGCKVISMSLGAEPDERHSAIFEQVAQTVMGYGCLLVGATGNDSKRGRMAPVNHPADCPSIVAVGALTAGMRVAEFSCGGAKGVRLGTASGSTGDGQVDLVAPGENIVSAKVGGGYAAESGTSMAAPFVAGMAALLWEQYPNASAWEIWVRLVQNARRLPLAASAVGAGLVYTGVR